MSTRMFERESSLCFNSVDFEREGFDADSFVSNHGRLMDLDSLLGDLRSYHNKIKQSLIEVINCDYEHFVGLSKTLSGLQPVIERVDSPLGQWHSKLQKVRAEVVQLGDKAERVIEEKRRLSSRKEQLMALKAVYTILAFLEHSLFDRESGQGRSLSLEDMGTLKRLSLQLSSLHSKVAACDPETLSETVEERVRQVEQHLLSQLGSCLQMSVASQDHQALLSLLQIYCTIERMNCAYQVYRSKFVHPYLKDKLVMSAGHVDTNSLHSLFQHILDFFPQKALFLATALNKSAQLSSISRPGSETTGVGMGRRFQYEVEAVFAEAVDLLLKNCGQLFMPVNWRQFAMCYKQCMLFLNQFEEQVLHSEEQVNLLRRSDKYRRLCDKWSLPVYFQLVFQEVVSKVEHAMSAQCRYLLCEEKVNDGDNNGMSLEVSREVVKCVQLCWGEEAYVNTLCHKFLKLTLQICLRYIQWVQQATPNYTPPQFQSSHQQNQNSANTATDTNVSVMQPSELSSNNVNNNFTTSISNSKQADTNSKVRTVETLDKLVMCLISDVTAFLAVMQTLFDLRIYRELKQCKVNRASGDPFASIRTQLKKELDVLVQKAVQSIASQLKDKMRPIGETPRLYRKTNRAPPEKESGYAKSVMSHLETVFEEQLSRVGPDCCRDMLHEVADQLCEEMRRQVEEICSSVEKIEHSLKKIRSSRNLKSSKDLSSLASSSNLASGEATGDSAVFLSDSEKIYLQLYIDVQFIINRLSSLGKMCATDFQERPSCVALVKQIEFAAPQKLKSNLTRTKEEL